MPSTYEPIATTTLGSAAASITFSSIPATYTDLRLVLVGKGNGGEIYPKGYFNSDSSSSNYSYTTLEGNGSAASSGGNTNNDRFALLTTGYPNNTVFTFVTFDIFSYAGSTFKTGLATTSTDKNGSGGTGRIVNLWRSTAAITGITVTDGGAGFGWAAGTTATLYGILKA